MIISPVLTLRNNHNAGNIACLTTACLHINWKVHMACDLNFIVKGEGLLKSRAVTYTGKMVITDL